MRQGKGDVTLRCELTMRWRNVEVGGIGVGLVIGIEVHGVKVVQLVYLTGVNTLPLVKSEERESQPSLSGRTMVALQAG